MEVFPLTLRILPKTETTQRPWVCSTAMCHPIRTQTCEEARVWGSVTPILGRSLCIPGVLGRCLEGSWLASQHVSLPLLPFSSQVNARPLAPGHMTSLSTYKLERTCQVPSRVGTGECTGPLPPGKINSLSANQS